MLRKKGLVLPGDAFRVREEKRYNMYTRAEGGNHYQDGISRRRLQASMLGNTVRRARPGPNLPPQRPAGRWASAMKPTIERKRDQAGRLLARIGPPSVVHVHRRVKDSG